MSAEVKAPGGGSASPGKQVFFAAQSAPTLATNPGVSNSSHVGQRGNPPKPPIGKEVRK
jgi:hypothetical protein